MGSGNGVKDTVEINAASAPPNERVPSRGTSESPPDVDKQSSSKPHPQDWAIYILAGVVVVGFFVLTMLLIIREKRIDTGHKDIVFMLFGGLVTGFSMVLSYFFGSSAGSAQKTVELAKVAKNR